jgi:hypothetical protein
MTALPNMWARFLRRPAAATNSRPAGADAVRLAAISELERVMDVWSCWWTGTENHKSDEQLAVASRHVDTALQTFFGQEALLRLRASSNLSGSSGTILLTADRLFVALIGRRAAMAVTRKVYSHLR